jgi:adenylylsulfate kinase
LNHMSEQGVIA